VKRRLRYKYFVSPLFIKRKPYTYRGTFTSFEAALKLAPTNLEKTYESDDQLYERISLELSCLYNSSYSVDVVKYFVQRINFLPTFLSGYKGFVKILDVGGGGGLLSLQLKTIAPKSIFEITIVEYQKFVDVLTDKIEKENLNIEDIHWVSEFPNNQSFNVVYFGSSLQYFEDWKATLESIILKNSCEYMIFSDTAMNAFVEFVTLQSNLKGRAIPRWVFNSTIIKNFMEERNFELILETTNFTPNHSFENFDYPHSLSTHRNMIFRSRLGIS
jgi:putative methyltransferase (TIGR04325 family)